MYDNAMNTQLAKLLVDLGLNQKEARIYLAALELEEASVQEIAKKSGVKRTNVYYILDDLKEKGFMFELKSSKRTLFKAESPEEILSNFKKRIENLNSNINLFKSVISKNKTKPKVYFFDGKEGFVRIWDTILKPETREYLIIAEPREMLGFVKKGYITGRIIKKKVDLGIKSRQIVAPSEHAKEIMLKDKEENRTSKILPHNFSFSFTTIIFGLHVALISPARENMVMLIESEEYANTQRAFFEALWSLLPLTSRANFATSD